MKPQQPIEKFRKDYRPTDFFLPSVQLDFSLGKESTLVRSKLEVQRRTQGNKKPLLLDGEELEIVSIRLDGKVLAPTQYMYENDQLCIAEVPDHFELETEVRLRPQKNTQLSGLYSSGKMFCTQCEAEGFRRITFFLDRPDVMSRFKVRICGQKEDFPVLLSNGNCTEDGKLDGGDHYTVWEDPFPKPSYLFALVAGDLGSIHDEFITCSGRRVALHIYTEHQNVGQLDFAMESLKKAMAWDEKVFGLEYDLDTFNVVAVGDFNMGAMENKSLNIFNTSCVLAQPETATDFDYERIEGVIGHEYFHNWTGNRVTCRDWFQLTLKEGLTVFRDQQFSADMGSAAVKRIEDVRALRSAQFPEDAGPMAHPIRPESYVAMDNFYTSTVYNKGAEVIRMMHTLVGAEGFRRGMDLYFQRHDGQAVSCDDFRAAIADANQIDLTQFERWYSQAGTPVLKVKEQWDRESGSYTLRICQECPATPGQPQKELFHIPIAMGLLSPQGEDLIGTQLLELREQEQSFCFDGFQAKPIPSILRDFSAPVRVEMDLSNEELAHLLAHDSDSFQRWEAGQKLSTRILLAMVKAIQNQETPAVPQQLLDAFAAVMADDHLDRSLKAYALMLPDTTTLAAEMEVIDPDALHQARRQCLRALAKHLRPQLETNYATLATDGPYVFHVEAVGRRRLRNLCLSYLCSLQEDSCLKLAAEQFDNANNMTDLMAALGCLVAFDEQRRKDTLDQFYQRWQQHPLVVDKWLAVQASATHDQAFAEVEALCSHPAFDLRNPNKVRSLLRTFASNQLRFHQADGAGYQFLRDRILELDALNPQMAARIAGAFAQWRRFDAARQAKMQSALQSIANHPGLSKDTLEIVTRSLASA